MNNKFLIILINYNNWQDTIECIQSLNNCDIQNENIFLIENSSTNDSYQKLQQNLPKVKIIKTEKNLGFTGGNNLGLKYAVDKKYEYVILLNNDTIIEEKKSIQILINEMEKNQDVTLGTGRIFYYPNKDMIWYDGGKMVKWRGMATHNNYRRNKNEIKLNDKAKDVNFISGCFLCIRMSDFHKLGFMDENFFLYLDDIEYSSRALRNNLKLKYFPNSVIYHKANGENKLTTGMVYYSIRNRRLLINLHFGFHAKIYFEIVLVIKRIVWFLTGNKFYRILVDALNDYDNKYFGQAPEKTK